MSNNSAAHIGNSSNNSFRLIPGVKPLYILPEDPLVSEVLIPSFRSATSVDCMMGFFSSEVLASLAPGLATLINESDGDFRLIISPVLRDEDRQAIQEGIIPIDEVARIALQNTFVTEDHIQNHTLRCLTWLLKMGRLHIKIALMRDAMFHPKVWLFQDKSDFLAIHGSSNLTYAGIQKNIEQVAVSKSWEDPSQRYITKRLQDQFSSLWDDKDNNCIVVDMPDALREHLVQGHSSTTPPRESDLRSLYRRASMFLKESSPIYRVEKKVFTIPPWLRYEDGPFAHQGKAVGAWCDAGHNGILEMATGSGKTIAAMIAAHRLYESSKPLLIVVSAPYIPLIQQWCDEIEPFGIEPVNLTVSNGPRGRARVLGRLRRRLRSGASEVQAAVVSHRTLSDERFQAELQRFDCTTLLIADEAHNLGSEGFISKSS